MAVTTIRVREQVGRQSDVDSFVVRVDFDGQGEYQALVSSPADRAAETELAWYFEQHLRFPFLDWDRRDAAAAALANYGRQLFGQLFAGEAHYSYRRVRDAGFDGCRIEVIGSAGLHRLHWEALRDPDLETPLGVLVPVVRRVTDLGARYDLPSGCDTVNILVVTARPDGPHDVGYRTISRPLLDAVRQARLPVNVQLVRPGTWAALRTALQQATETHGTGYFHVVHFDVHGLFGDRAELEAGKGRYLLQPGLSSGRHGMLFFETEKEGQAEAVSAQQVASLLAEHRVPVAVLNACQSATQSDVEASLAQQLAQAGVPLALGMAYSVTVSAAQISMPVLYARLAEGADPIKAAHAARRVLFEKRGRRGYFDQDVDLEDWVLPVVFGQRPFTIKLEPAQAAYYEREAAIASEPKVRYGFVGRDLDIQVIERRLLTSPRHNMLVVRGMAGAGKSTLLEHLGWWWRRTGLIEDVFAYSYEDRAWTADQIVRDVASRILPAADRLVFESLSEQGRAEQVARFLRSRRHLLVLDNAESITASPASIPHALDTAQRQQLVAMLDRLRGGRSLVLVGSRQDESWLSNDIGVYALPGLDKQAASQLTERILNTHGGSHDSPALQELLDLLGGYPLPLTIVLPTLATTPPEKVLAALKAGGAEADPERLIHQAIEYSHGGLDPKIQRSMLLLAPFTNTIPSEGPILAAYQQLLAEALPGSEAEGLDLAAAVAETTRVGLSTLHTVLRDHVHIVPVLPFFLRARLNDQPDLKTTAQQAHYRLHHDLASTFHDMLKAHTPQKQATGTGFVNAYFANLTSALDHGTDTGQPILWLVAAIAVYLQHRSQQPVLADLLNRVIKRHQPQGHQESLVELAVLHGFAGRTALELHKLDEAKSHYQTELQLRQQVGDRNSQGIIHHQLGIVAQGQELLDEASRHYQLALDIKLEFDNRLSAAATYHQMAIVAQRQRRYDEATSHLQQSLDIKLEFDDRPSAAATYHQMGIVAQRQQRYDEATSHLQKALDIDLEFGNRHSAASTYGQLGNLLKAQGSHEQATRLYQRAMDIFHEVGDRRGEAIARLQMGNIVFEQRRHDEARRHYVQALEVFVEFGDRYNAAITHLSIGRLETTVGRHSSGARALLEGCALWHEITAEWPSIWLELLVVARQEIGEAEFERHLAEKVPPHLIAALRNVLNGQS